MLLSRMCGENGAGDDANVKDDGTDGDKDDGNCGCGKDSEWVNDKTDKSKA